MRLVDWSGSWTSPATVVPCARCTAAGWAPPAEVERLLRQVEALSAALTEAGGDPRKVRRAA